MSIWRWADWIDYVPQSYRITLGEGDTPLVRSRRIGPAVGLTNLYFKLETGNPAGSFKDRMGAAAISHMLAEGQSRCIATSSGNTGSALAAYCAAAGIRCQIAIVETAPEGKLRQMMAYGADIFRIRAFGLDPQVTTETFQTLQRLAERPEAALQISSYIYSPKGMSGVETISFELAEQLDGVQHVFCPAGGGGLCLAVVRGFATLTGNAKLPRSPAVHCVQPEGNDTMASPLRVGAARATEIASSTTKISGLQVPNVNDGDLVVEQCRASGGTGHVVTDAAVWDLQRRLAQEEGLFSEPAGAVALAGAIEALRNGDVDANDNVVCLVTGSGFKDEESVSRMVAEPCPMIELADLERRVG